MLRLRELGLEIDRERERRLAAPQFSVDNVPVIPSPLLGSNSLNGIVNQGGKIIGIKQTGLSSSFDQFVLQKDTSIGADCARPLFQEIKILPSGIICLNYKVTGIDIILFPLMRG